MFSGQQYNLTGSSEVAELGQAFTWTCGMFVPPGCTLNVVEFYRNSTKCVVIGHVNNDCLYQSYNSKYTYACQSDNVYTLTIPAENMTQNEQGSMWRCQYILHYSYKSSEAILNIASKMNIYTHVHNSRV